MGTNNTWDQDIPTYAEQKIGKSLIIVGEKYVSIHTEIDWASIEIQNQKGLNGYSIDVVLPTTYIVVKNELKTIILNLFGGINQELKLFMYYGAFNPMQVFIYDKRGKREACLIVQNKELWGDWRETWNTGTRKYSDMKFNGNNWYRTKLKTGNFSANLKQDEILTAKGLKKTKFGKDIIKRRTTKRRNKNLPQDRIHPIVTGMSVKDYKYEDGSTYSGKVVFEIISKTYFAGETLNKNSKPLIANGVNINKKNAMKKLKILKRKYK